MYSFSMSENVCIDEIMKFQKNVENKSSSTRFKSMHGWMENNSNLLKEPF